MPSACYNRENSGLEENKYSAFLFATDLSFKVLGLSMVVLCHDMVGSLI